MDLCVVILLENSQHLWVKMAACVSLELLVSSNGQVDRANCRGFHLTMLPHCWDTGQCITCE